jgi:hypothetical protein
MANRNLYRAKEDVSKFWNFKVAWEESLFGENDFPIVKGPRAMR